MEELFGNRMAPACHYCENACPISGGEQLICGKKGLVQPDFACRAFRYDPLMRIPRRPLELQPLEPEDFSL